jgi:RecG-like helicase
VTGKVEYKNKDFQIIHPSNVLDKSNISSYESIYPEYNLSRKKINKKIFRNIILKNLPNLEQSFLPDEWIEKNKLNKEKWISFKKQ